MKLTIFILNVQKLIIKFKTMRYVSKLIDKNIKESEQKDYTWLWLTLGTAIVLLIVMAFIGIIKVNAVNIGGYVESNCQNTKCEVIKWNGRNILISLF